MFVALVGCKQVFGLDEPQPRVDSAVHVEDGALSEDGGPPLDAAPDASPFLACAPSDATLIACFDFENEVVDGSAAQTPAAATGVTYVEGVYGMAVHATATSVMTVMDDPVFDVAEVSIEAWVYLDELPASAGARVGIWDTDGKFGMFVYGDGSISCTTGTGVRSAASSVQKQDWIHIACTHSSAATRVYRDGVMITQGGGGAIAGGTQNGSVIGGNSPSGDRLVGAIDQLRVYGVVRSDAQVCAAANC